MFTATKNSVDSLLKSFSTNSTNKSTSELFKVDNSKAASMNDNFKKVLNSKTGSSQQEDTQKVDNTNQNETSTEVNDTDEVNEVKEKLEELEKESKSSSKEKASDILTELLSLLAKLGIKEDDLKSNGNMNADALKGIIEGINNKSSHNNLNSIMEKIMELLKDDSVKDKLDTNSLKTMEKLLGNLSSNLGNDNTGATKGIKSLMSEISNILDKKENQANKVLTLEDMLSKNYSQENSESSTDSNNSRTSKEDKFLNSLVDDNKDDSLNKINLFASRTGTIQNQGVNTVRGLAIDKATFTGDLIKDVKYMSTNSLKELTVKVNPGNLGEITIKLVQEGDLMKANLKANSKETAALLSQNLSDIKKQLGEQNLKIADVNIELYQDDTTFFKEQGFGRQFSEDQGNSNSGSSNNLANQDVIGEEELASINASNDNNLDFFA
jgi:flagellar hook-length control protein FliK